MILSLAANVWLYVRHDKRLQQSHDVNQLFFTKVISYQEGYQALLKALAEQGPQLGFPKTKLVFYRWDSLYYDYPLVDDMLVFDSLAAANKNPDLHFVFITEMEKEASEAFLHRNHADFRNTIFLYAMDDFISGLYYYQKDMAQQKTGSKPVPLQKRSVLYLVMNERGELSTNDNTHYRLLKDSVFFCKLKSLMVPTTERRDRP